MMPDKYRYLIIAIVGGLIGVILPTNKTWVRILVGAVVGVVLATFLPRSE
jgi:hypothetical protein